ncbi:MAG: two-component system sensor histidine kinase NtrB [Planctomycetota bacterium]|jgi:two-component system sensor histidine kinase PilS (NtrC family)
MHYTAGIDAGKRLLWTAALRAVLCVFVAGVIRLNGEPSARTADLLPYFVVAAAFILNFTFVVLWRSGVSPRPLACAHIWIDVVFVTALVYLTGGAGSDFLLLFFGPILTAGVVFRRSLALLVASMATIGLFFCAAGYYAVTPRDPVLVQGLYIGRGRPGPGALVGILGLQAAAFHLVAFLSSTLALRLRSANIQTEQILENMSDGVITVERTGRVVFSNTPAESLLELERTPIVGSPFWDLAPVEVRDALHEVLRNGAARSVETSVGSTRTPVMLTVLPLSDQAGGLRGANVILHDLTERRNLTEALRRAERLEAAAASAASIAHEVRNPLAAIRASAQELARGGQLPPSDRGLVNLVVGESDRLNRIVTDFLNFSRKSKPQIAPAELRSLLEEVARQLAVLPDNGNADIEVEGVDELWLPADGEQLRQVFLNLGSNALDATSGCGPVRFKLDADNATAAVNVLDAGCGVDDAIAGEIFEPFFTTKTNGTGLGLAIARRIVENHGGSLDLCEPENGWTRVKVLLPFAEGKAEPDEENTPPADA